MKLSLRVESLELRTVPAVFLWDNYLAIAGENPFAHLPSVTDDVAIVEDWWGPVPGDPDGTPTNLPAEWVQVTLNGNETLWEKLDFPKGIIFDGLQGNDQFFNLTSVFSNAHGSQGNDTLSGGPGADLLLGDDGNDHLLGNFGNDELYGGKDNDTLDGGFGDNTLWGESGMDSLVAVNGKDRLDGGSENDTLRGGWGDDYLNGGSQNDDIDGEYGNDTLVGGSGNDTLDGGYDHDSVSGGNGNDDLEGGNGNGNDTLSGGNDNDNLWGMGGMDLLLGDSGKDNLWGGDGHDSLKGGNGNDTLDGEDGNDALYGEDGNDSLYGGSGNDGLTPGYGNDKAWGQADEDRFLKLHNGKTWNGWTISVGKDNFQDVEDEDAIINFKIGQLTWTHAELEAVDQGLAILHTHIFTNHTQLLKMPNGDALNFYRDQIIDEDDITEEYEGVVTPETVGGLNKGGGEIRLYDHGMADNVIGLILHELGHNWQGDANPFWDDFKNVSCWTTNPPDDNYILSPSGVWYYHQDLSTIGQELGFVSTYAWTNPNEDFAETFAYYFLFGMSHSNEYIDAKLDTITDQLIDLW